jgi:acetyl esterase/lipase
MSDRTPSSSTAQSRPHDPVDRNAHVPPGICVHRDLEYVPGGGLAQSLDVYVPQQTGLEPLRLLVWIHGGGWWKGSKEHAGQAINYALRGYVVASLAYRFSTVAKFPAQIQDCQAAIRWLRGNCHTYRIDPERIGVWGSSAGGHLANLLGTAGGQEAFAPIGQHADQSDRVQAVCAYCGPSDLHAFRAHAGQNPEVKSLVEFNTPKDPYSAVLGIPLGQDAGREKSASPAHYVRRDVNNPSFLLVHGTHDQHVPFEQAQHLAKVLRAHGASVTLQRLPGGDHKTHQFYLPSVLKLVESFFDKTLKGLDQQIEALPDDAVMLSTPLAAQV